MEHYVDEFEGGSLLWRYEMVPGPDACVPRDHIVTRLTTTALPKPDSKEG